MAHWQKPRMPSIDSMTTFSGIFVFVGTMVLLLRYITLGAILYLITGSAGVGIFWDRWSERVGHQDQIFSLLQGPAPSGHEFILLASHGPLLIVGLAFLTVVMLDRHQRGVDSSPHVSTDTARAELS